MAVFEKSLIITEITSQTTYWTLLGQAKDIPDGYRLLAVQAAAIYKMLIATLTTMMKPETGDDDDNDGGDNEGVFDHGSLRVYVDTLIMELRAREHAGIEDGWKKNMGSYVMPAFIRQVPL